MKCESYISSMRKCVCGEHIKHMPSFHTFYTLNYGSSTEVWRHRHLEQSKLLDVYEQLMSILLPPQIWSAIIYISTARIEISLHVVKIVKAVEHAISDRI